MTIRSFARTRSWAVLMPLFLLAQAVAAIGRVPWPGSLLMPAAAAFLAVGVWLYFRLDVPGAAHLAASAGRYRERAGASFWPAVAVIPVQVLGWELFTGLGKPGPVPAVTAVLAMIVCGMFGLVAFVNPGSAGFLAVWILPLIVWKGIFTATHGPGSAGVGLYGVILVDSHLTAVVADVQGVLLILADVWLGWKLVQGVTGWGGASRTAQLKLRVETLTRTRADAVDTAAAELRRIERDLHDGAQARLVALGISLRWPRACSRPTRTPP